MREDEIPDKNIFMMCETLDRNVLAGLPVGFSIRNCRPDELGVWKAMPFDNPDLAKEYDGFMADYFQTSEPETRNQLSEAWNLLPN